MKDRSHPLLPRLIRSRSGVAMTEFALAMPLLLTAGLGGIQTAHYVIVQMQISQTAIHLADNASRIGEVSALENRKIYESDINDVMIGANFQAGEGLDLFRRGRVIISSVEVFDEDVHCDDVGDCVTSSASEGDQFIHWQRCMGEKTVGPAYGGEGAVLPEGIGPDGDEVTAIPGDAVIFVEVFYDYEPLIAMFSFARSHTMSAVASFNVRDSRDLSCIYQRNSASPDFVADCGQFSGIGAIAS